MSSLSVASVIILCLSRSIEMVKGKSIDETSLSHSPQSKVIMPASCADKNYCFDKGDHYPQNELRVLMEEVIQKIKQEVIGDRDGFGPDCEDLDCPAVIYRNQSIYYVKDQKKRVRIVIQIPEYHQTNDVVTCHSSGLIENTRNFDKKTNTHFHCEDMKVAQELYVVNLEWSGVEKVKIDLPVCCRCIYKD